jgi:hypothetical protein
VLLLVVGLFGLFLPLLAQRGNEQPSVFGSIIPLFMGLWLTFHLRLSAWLSFKRDFANQPKTEAVVSDSGVSLSSPKGN